MKKSDFHFDLPDELIAQSPLAERSASRLLVVDAPNDRLLDRRFTDLVDLVAPGDLLVFNDTRVIPARLYGRKETGGAVEILIERITGTFEARAQLGVSKKPKAGACIALADGSVATVEGRLRPEITFVSLLRATFPGGSITGAPKIRAMEIIEELEPVRRGPYCGAIGYVASDGSLQFNVAIRTMTIQTGIAYVPVGGGIVADSDPAAEYEETLVKAQAMFAALGVSG